MFHAPSNLQIVQMGQCLTYSEKLLLQREILPAAAADFSAHSARNLITGQSRFFLDGLPGIFNAEKMMRNQLIRPLF